MAAFCYQCAIDCDWDNDLAGITTEADWEKGLAAEVLCEGCGMIQVDPKGRCVTSHAPEEPFSAGCTQAGKPGHGLPWKNAKSAS